ncbi:MAG TPA: ferredoxin reductase [Gemmatimonadaceae bacterium]
MTQRPNTVLAPARLEWRVARVLEVRDETPRARTLILDVPDWPGHRAGQHVDVRLVAEDGYEAQRSYSIASAPEDPNVALTVERLPNAEVSPYLCEVLQPGDGLEVRGPIGGWFVWEQSMGTPLFLVAGGSGIVPLMSMLRHYANVTPVSAAHPTPSSRTSEATEGPSPHAPLSSRGSGATEGPAHHAPLSSRGSGATEGPADHDVRGQPRAPSLEGPSSPAAPRDDTPVTRVRLLYSARTWDDIIYRDELQRLAERPDIDVVFTLTREAPAIWHGYRRRIDRAMLEEVGWPPAAAPRAYVCGPTLLVESVASLLVEMGHDPARIRTERFGPTG